MSQASRRNVLNALGWCAALPALSISIPLAARARSVRFPERPLRLRRELERGLGGGASLLVTREWECRFSALESGARIEARQLAVTVDAPPPLASLAEIERKREVTGLFPMTLDSNGVIVGWPEGDASIQHAVERASRLIEERAREQNASQDVRRQLAEIGRTAASLVSQVPRDLFFPQAGKRSESRALDLPGGAEGSYEVSVSVSAEPASGLLRQSERRIVTRIGDSARVSRETWAIA